MDPHLANIVRLLAREAVRAYLEEQQSKQTPEKSELPEDPTEKPRPGKRK